MKRFSFVLVAAFVVLSAGQSGAAPTPAEKCEAARNQLAGKYYACREKAESTAIKKALAPDYSKCTASFGDKWDDADVKAGGACPDDVTTPGMDAYLAGQAAEAALIISGAENIPACGDGDVNAVGEHCDGVDLDGYSCATFGYSNGTLGCTMGCDFDATPCFDCAVAGGVTIGGACWFYGTNNQDCDAACAGAGLVYDEATNTYAGAGAADSSGCAAVAAALAPAVPFSGDHSCGSGFNGCAVDTGLNQGGRCTTPATTSTGANVNQRRFCACQ